MAYAAGDSHPIVIYGANNRIALAALDSTGAPTTPTSPDTELSIDDAAFGDATNEYTEPSGGAGEGYLDLTGAECTASKIIGRLKSSNCLTTPFAVYPERLSVLESDTAEGGGASTITLAVATASGKNSYYNGCYILLTNNTPAGVQYAARRILSYVGSTRVATVDAAWGTNPSSSTTYSILMPPAANVVGWAGAKIVDPDVAGAPKADVGYFGGTTLTSSSGIPSVNASKWAGGAIPAPNVTGVPIIDLKYILGTLLTETAGLIAAGFKKFFNVASPTGTVNSLPDAVPGAAGGLLVDDVWTDARAAKLDNLDATISSRGTGAALDAAGVRSAVGLASANLDTQLAGVQSDTDNIQTRLPAALTGDGLMKADTLRIGGTLQTAGDVVASAASILGKFTGITLLAQWLGLIAGKHTGNATARTELNATGAGSGTYDETTDSTQAIRDRGDAAWGSSGSTTKQIVGALAGSGTSLRIEFELLVSGQPIAGASLSNPTVVGVYQSGAAIVFTATSTTIDSNGRVRIYGTLASAPQGNRMLAAEVTIDYAAATLSGFVKSVALSAAA